jgi:hypothetical protein
LRFKIPCTWFFNRVRWRTRWARRDVWRRNARVRSSGTHTDGKEVRGQQLRQDPASTLSVFTFASAMARVLAGFDTTSRATRGAIKRGDGVAVPGRFQRHLIVWAQRLPTMPAGRAGEPDPALVA